MVIETPQKKKKRLWTFEQLLAEVPESNLPTELWDGELIMAPSPTPVHQAVVARLARTIDEFAAQHNLGKVYFAPLDVIFTQRRVVQPDVIFVSNAKLAIIQDRIRGTPDLIVEVVSPGTWRRDYIDKRAIYAQFGVSEYWIVDPEAEMIEVLFLEAGTFRLVDRFGRDQHLRSRLLVDFEISVNDILG